MLHACFVVIPTCFMCTFIHFLAFSGTNLLTRCRSASSCFFYFCVSEKLYRKYSRNCTGQKPRTLFLRNKAGARRWSAGGPGGAQTRPRRGPRAGRAWHASGHPVAPLCCPFSLRLRYGEIRYWGFVPCNSENISCTNFLKYKNNRKQKLALWHLVNRLVAENV